MAVDTVLDRYRKRMKRRGDSQYERTYKNKERDTEYYFNNTINIGKCIIDGVEQEVVFQDQSQGNNKDLSDDKYLVARNNVKVKVGSYVTWSDEDWIVFTKESKTVPTHQQLKIKTVNETIKWIKDGEICNGGEGFGAHVQNQTLYTLGVAKSGHFLDVVNAKMMMYMQNNEETSKLRIGDRIFIGFGVYKVMFTDIVSRKGLINYLLEQDTISEYDNKELRIADYWKNGQLPDEDKNPSSEIPVINGNAQGRISRTFTYKIQDGYSVDEWIVDEAGLKLVEILERSDTHITLKIIDNKNNVGNKAILFAKVGDVVASLTIRIASKF